MMKPVRSIAGLLVFGALVSASAAAVAQQSLGWLGSNPVHGTVEKTFLPDLQTPFVHYYTFSVGAGRTVFGITQDIAKTGAPDVALSSLTLTSVDQATTLWSMGSLIDDQTTHFTFTGLAEGAYTLAVHGHVFAGDPFGPKLAKYVLNMYASVPTGGGVIHASPAPEPATALMAALGLAGVGWWARRAKRAG